jgi:hypothetical protein
MGEIWGSQSGEDDDTHNGRLNMSMVAHLCQQSGEATQHLSFTKTDALSLSLTLSYLSNRFEW